MSPSTRTAGAADAVEHRDGLDAEDAIVGQGGEIEAAVEGQHVAGVRRQVHGAGVTAVHGGKAGDIREDEGVVAGARPSRIGRNVTPEHPRVRA